MVLGLTLHAQYKGYTPIKDPAAFQTAFAAAAQKTNSFRADFVQEKNLSLLEEKIVSKGKFWFRRENLVRMEYQQPFQYLMIINGNLVHIKDGQKENTVSVKSNRLFQKINTITIDCVRGTALQNGDFQSKVFDGQQYFLLELVPVSKELKDLFAKILLYLDRKDYSVQRIDMVENGGDNTLITFNQKEVNVQIPDAVFAVKK
ncbi:hypothetical protein FPE01S_01_10940 [Flavihumibacter petaseus NBRC 106054]|uniref:Outer membrane lipoprotein carrier protein LolA n=2 Tax=Flavihumibacter TaxID=1004301 RepID=A0A0E9MXD6_9BACT|nr:hypothetical protein FPE01S_01_10940 [Flavihumibacter petaseus NBRC 106054]